VASEVGALAAAVRPERSPALLPQQLAAAAQQLAAHTACSRPPAQGPRRSAERASHAQPAAPVAPPPCVRARSGTAAAGALTLPLAGIAAAPRISQVRKGEHKAAPASAISALAHACRLRLAAAAHTSRRAIRKRRVCCGWGRCETCLTAAFWPRRQASASARRLAARRTWLFGLLRVVQHGCC
jgi:hypothetical protein